MKLLKWENAVEWGEIECPMMGDEMITTYYPSGGRAYDSVTAPILCEDGEVGYYKFDHDRGCWDEDFYSMLEVEYREGMTFSL